MKTTTKTFLKPLLFIAIGISILTIAYASISIEKPGPPGEPVAIDKKSGECTIAYLPPKDDGGTPIIRYIIEYRKEWNFSWHILGSSKGLEYHASGFQDGDCITFRVRAENKMGAGEPSKPSDFITLEDRYRYSKP